MASEKRYHALRHNRNFAKMNVEFLIFALAKNISYIFLLLESLHLLGLSKFNLRVQYLPNITLLGEWNNFVAHGYNPFWLYYHFLELFFTIVKNIALYMYNTVIHNVIPGLIICFLIVLIWLVYSRMSYGYSHSESKKHNYFWSALKKLLFTSNILERSLWMIFSIELLGFVLTPQRLNIICLIILWGLIVSVKMTPVLSNFIVDLTNKLERSIFNSHYVIWVVVLVDVVLIYFDSDRLFALLVMVLIYTTIAQGVFYLVRDSRQLTKWSKYIFNFGVFLFFFSLIVVYYIAYVITNLFLLPFWIYYFWTKKKPLPPKFVEYADMIMVILLIVWYFK